MAPWAVGQAAIISIERRERHAKRKRVSAVSLISPEWMRQLETRRTHGVAPGGNSWRWMGHLQGATETVLAEDWPAGAGVGLTLLAERLYRVFEDDPGRDPTVIPSPAAGGETARVTYVIDGDTIDVRIGTEIYRVRYVGVNTPERDEPCYNDATRANAVLVDDQVVTLVRDVSDTDKYGRLLRYVYAGVRECRASGGRHAEPAYHPLTPPSPSCPRIWRRRSGAIGGLPSNRRVSLVCSTISTLHGQPHHVSHPTGRPQSAVRRHPGHRRCHRAHHHQHCLIGGPAVGVRSGLGRNPASGRRHAAAARPPRVPLRRGHGPATRCDRPRSSPPLRRFKRGARLLVDIDPVSYCADPAQQGATTGDASDPAGAYLRAIGPMDQSPPSRRHDLALVELRRRPPPARASALDTGALSPVTAIR